LWQARKAYTIAACDVEIHGINGYNVKQPHHQNACHQNNVMVRSLKIGMSTGWLNICKKIKPLFSVKT
jgi:hypothetical protein